MRKTFTISAFDKSIDQINIAFALMVFVFLSCIVFLKFSRPENIEQIIESTHSAASNFQVLNLSKKSSKYYQRILGRRELFVAQAGIKVKKSSRLNALANESIGDDLQLLGIVSGAQGPQAIIMDSKSGKSFYCSGGEQISGFTVTDILENKVILKNDGETKEIRL